MATKKIQIIAPNADLLHPETESSAVIVGAGNLDTALAGKVPTTDVVTSPTANKILKLDANSKLPASITGNSATADKLTTARTISLVGEVTGSVTFDGSGNASMATTYQASDVLTKIKTVDGSGSGLDADMLDGYHMGNGTYNIPINNGTINTDLNADKLDGYHSSDLVKIPSGLNIALAKNTDLNTVTTTGFYHVESPVNAGAGWWYLLVEAYPGWYKQTLTAFGSGNSEAPGDTFVRVKTNGTTWSTWQQVLTKKDGNYNITGNIIMESSGERIIKSSGANSGMFFNSVGFGMFDWANGRSIFSYNGSTNTTVFDRIVNLYAGAYGVGRISIFSWSGTITPGNYVDIQHWLGYNPIVCVSPTANVATTFTTRYIDYNTIRIGCNGASGNPVLVYLW